MRHPRYLHPHCNQGCLHSGAQVALTYAQERYMKGVQCTLELRSCTAQQLVLVGGLECAVPQQFGRALQLCTIFLPCSEPEPAVRSIVSVPHCDTAAAMAYVLLLLL